MIYLVQVRPHSFDLLDYVTHQSEKLGFQKNLKKKGFGDLVVRNITTIVAETL